MALAFGGLLLAGEVPARGDSPGTGEPRRIRLDYIPALLYQDDNIHIHLTVLPPVQAGDSIRLESFGMDRQDRERPVGTQNKDAGPDGTVDFIVRPGDRQGTASFRLSLVRGGHPIESLSFHLARAFTGLPVLSASGQTLRDDQGAACVILLQHRIPQTNREWLPLRKAMDLVYTRPPSSRSKVVSDLPLPSKRPGEMEVFTCPPSAPPSVPIYESIAAASHIRKTDSRYGQVLFVGSRDAQFGTSPPVYRMGLEVILQHLEAVGATEFRIALPISAPPYQGRLVAYREQALEVATIYRATPVVSLNSLLGASFWAASPAGSVLRLTPSPEALEQIVDVFREQAQGPR